MLPMRVALEPETPVPHPGLLLGTEENDINNGLFLCEGLVSFQTKSIQQKLSTLKDRASLVMLCFYIGKLVLCIENNSETTQISTRKLFVFGDF